MLHRPRKLTEFNLKLYLFCTSVPLTLLAVLRSSSNYQKRIVDYAFQKRKISCTFINIKKFQSFLPNYSHLKMSKSQIRVVGVIRNKWIFSIFNFKKIVMDRLFLVVFTLSYLMGTASILLQAKSFFDMKVPIDMLLSRTFNRSIQDNNWNNLLNSL